MWPAEQNCIRSGDIKLDGYKKNAICKPFKLSVMKAAAAKYNKSTINDLVMGMAAVACKEYMLKRGEDKKSLNLIIPFSMRPLPKTADDLKLCNDFSGMSFTLDLSRDLKEATEMCQKKTRKLKSSLYPHGIRALGEIASILPGMLG